MQYVSTKLESVSPPGFSSFKFVLCSASSKEWDNDHYPVPSRQAMSMLDVNSEFCGKKLM